jgi:hypothetical protein
VRKGSEREFEQVWLTRKSHLEEVPGFVVFHLLRGPEKDDHVLYASHSQWRSEEHFAALDALGGLPQGACGSRHRQVALSRPSRARMLHRAPGGEGSRRVQRRRRVAPAVNSRG